MRPLLYFDKIKEIRDGGFVEYNPPPNTYNFALLHLTVLKGGEPCDTARLLEDETALWLARFPAIPIMASAFDDTDDSIDLTTARPSSFLYAWTDGPQSTLTWDEPAFSAFTNMHPLDFDLRTIFQTVGCRTDAEIKELANLHLAKIRTGNRILRWGFWLWVAVIPATWAVVEFLGPQWLGVIVLLYSLWKALKEGQKVLGHHKPSESEKEKSEKDRKKDHYFYHCERNPTGFTRLMCENLERDARQRVLEEAKKLGVSLPPANPCVDDISQDTQ